MVKIKKHEYNCKGEENYVQTDKKVNDLEDNTDETDSIDSTEESGDIFTANHQETLQVNDGIDEEVRCTNFLNPGDTFLTLPEKD